jgi:L-glyceraldehyde 3-phosphate reductase
MNRPGGDSLQPTHLRDENLTRVRDPRVTSGLIGASHPEQVVENVGALARLEFSPEELAAIEGFAQEGGVNMWERPAHDERP